MCFFPFGSKINFHIFHKKFRLESISPAVYPYNFSGFESGKRNYLRRKEKKTKIRHRKKYTSPNNKPSSSSQILFLTLTSGDAPPRRLPRAQGRLRGHPPPRPRRPVRQRSLPRQGQPAGPPVRLRRAGAGHLGGDHDPAPLQAPPDVRQQLQRRRREAAGGVRQGYVRGDLGHSIIPVFILAPFQAT